MTVHILMVADTCTVFGSLWRHLGVILSFISWKHKSIKECKRKHFLSVLLQFKLNVPLPLTKWLAFLSGYSYKSLVWLPLKKPALNTPAINNLFGFFSLLPVLLRKGTLDLLRSLGLAGTLLKTWSNPLASKRNAKLVGDLIGLQMTTKWHFK